MTALATALASLVFWVLLWFCVYLAGRLDCFFGAATLLVGLPSCGIPLLVCAVQTLRRDRVVFAALLLAGLVSGMVAYFVIGALYECHCGCGYAG